MKSIYILFIFVLFTQCKKQEAPKNHHDHSKHEEYSDHEDHGLELTANQIKTIGLTYGTFRSIKTSNYVKASGQLDLPPNNVVAIHTPQAGFIKKSNYLVGDKVKKGTILTTLAHPSYIQLQQNYLDAYSQFQLLTKQLNREKQLQLENAGTQKKLDETEANHFSALSKKNALEEQLKFMGINISALKKGTITSKIDIKSPIDGVITHMNIHKGLYVKPEQELFELVDNDHMHIELQIFEKDLFKLKKGQKISFTLPSISNKIYDAEVYLIGQSLNSETKTVQVHGHLLKENPQFMKGLFTDAKIWLDSEKVNALPSDAVIQEQGKAYIFIKKTISEKHYDHHKKGHKHHHEEKVTKFDKIPVMILAEEDDYIEVKTLVKISKNAKIVTKGAFYLTSELRKSEAGHGHEH